MSNTSGVFTLDDLRAMGKTGDPRADWMAQTGKSGLIAGGGNAVLNASNLKAGYYTGIPGLEGAYYYDPASGQHPQEFINWANALKPEDRDPFSGTVKGFIPAEGGPQATFAARADQQASTTSTLKNIFAEKAAGYSSQEAQDRVLGLGKYQQFALDANGKQVRINNGAPDYAAPGTQSMFRNVSSLKDTTPAGGFGGYWKKDESGSMWVSYATKADLAANEASANANADALNYHNYDAYTGLQQERIDRGEDPNTGISAAEQKSIYETYGRISDPAERAAYIQAQDPGNLVPELQVARQSARMAVGGMGEEYAKMKSDMPEKYEYWSPQQLGGSSKDTGAVKVTIGETMMTDKMTGRETLYGNIPIKAEYTHTKTDKTTQIMDRVGGGLAGAFVGFAASIFTGNPLLGIMVGTYFGAGGPTTRMSIKNFGGPPSQWHIGGSASDWKQNQPHEPDIKEIFITVGTAAATAGISKWRHGTPLPGSTLGEGANAGKFGGGIWNRARVPTGT